MSKNHRFLDLFFPTASPSHFLDPPQDQNFRPIQHWPAYKHRKQPLWRSYSGDARKNGDGPCPLAQKLPKQATNFSPSNSQLQGEQKGHRLAWEPKQDKACLPQNHQIMVQDMLDSVFSSYLRTKETVREVIQIHGKFCTTNHYNRDIYTGTWHLTTAKGRNTCSPFSCFISWTCALNNRFSSWTACKGR